jgi:hypothetical protein
VKAALRCLQLVGPKGETKKSFRRRARGGLGGVLESAPKADRLAVLVEVDLIIPRDVLIEEMKESYYAITM